MRFVRREGFKDRRRWKVRKKKSGEIIFLLVDN